MKKITLKTVLAFLLLVSMNSCKQEVSGPELTATSIELVSGGDQTGSIENALANPIEVFVKDQNGDAFEGARVIFMTTDGTVSPETAATGVDGKAAVTWTLGATVGNQTLTVTAYKADGTTALTGSPVLVTSTGEDATTVTDVDGNIYPIVTIGDQVWMAENLKITKYANGTEIPLVNSNAAWIDLSNTDTDKAFCWYDSDEATNKDTYGALYTYAAATNGTNTGTEVQGVCPTGWHLPSDAEWTILTDYLGGESIAGGKLKETGIAHWTSPNIDATNETGFTALPGGGRNYDGVFNDIGNYGIWWSATQYDTAEAWGRSIVNIGDHVFRFNGFKSYGLSVRCVRDN